MKNFLLLSILCSTLHTTIFAQKQTLVDSLLAELSNAKEDTVKIKILNTLSLKVHQTNPDEGLRYGKEALELAEKLQWKKGIATAKLTIGRNYWRLSNFGEALNYHFQSLELWKEIGDRDRIAITHGFIGQDYADSGDYSQALKYMSLSLEGYEALGDKRLQSYVHSVMAWIYGNMGMYPENLKHQYAMLKIAEEAGDRYGASIAYSNLASTFEEQGNFEKAIEIYTQALKINMEFNDYVNTAGSYNSIGNCHKNMGNYSEALKNHQLALEIGKKFNDARGIGGAYKCIGNVHLAQGNLPEALKYYHRATGEYKIGEDNLAIAQLKTQIATCYTNMGNYGEARRYFGEAFSLVSALKSIAEFHDYYKGRAKLDSATGDWKNAFGHYRLFVSTRDSMHNEENTKKMVQTRMHYEFDKKEAAAKAEQEKKDLQAKEELEQQKLLRNGFMGGFAVVLLFAGIFFNQRNKIKTGKQRSDELLLNILPAEVAEELKAKGAAEAKMIDEVTVLFSDFKGFTEISETQTPGDLVAEINACFSSFDLIMQRHGIEKIKTVGDAYLAAGGLPTPNATHATDVLNAALEMQAFMQQRKQQRGTEGKFFFEARIGVHTGPVVAGIVGIKKFAYDIWGDTVNTAQRMESNSEAGRVNISGSTHELVKGQFHCTYRGKIEAKGKGEVDMYFVEGGA